MLPHSGNSKSKSTPKTKRSTTGGSVTKRKRRFETQARNPRSGRKVRKEDTSKALKIEHGDEESEEDKDNSPSQVESDFNLYAGRWGLLDDELPENKPVLEPEPPKEDVEGTDARRAKEV